MRTGEGVGKSCRWLMLRTSLRLWYEFLMRMMIWNLEKDFNDGFRLFLTFRVTLSRYEESLESCANSLRVSGSRFLLRDGYFLGWWKKKVGTWLRRKCGKKLRVYYMKFIFMMYRKTPTYTLLNVLIRRKIHQSMLKLANVTF